MYVYIVSSAHHDCLGEPTVFIRGDRLEVVIVLQ